MKRTIIYGPPGTGKTTQLISIMEKYLANGGKPNKIIFTSFTRKSIDEAVSRASAKFGVVKDQLPFFRTVHSLCMGLSGLKNTDVVQFTHKKEIADMLGLDLTSKRALIDGTSYGMKDGDKLFHLSDYYRSKQVDLETAWDENGREMEWPEVVRFMKAYEQYKSSRMLVDFTDMLMRFMKDGYLPHVDIMFVDEAQDLSTLQWNSVFRLEACSNSSYIAGDDDQGIYGWNGANVQTFIELDGDRKVLARSHRLNRAVFDTAMGIVGRISKRVPKSFEPSKSGGQVQEVGYIEDLPLDKGEWLLLARNGYMLQEYEDYCFEQGYLYETAFGYGPRKWPEMRAIIDWERYRQGHELPDPAWKNILQFTSNQSPSSELPWFEIFDIISKERIEYLRACKRNGEKFLDTPRIHINTIHGVKGGEAENVCVMLDLANTTWKTYESNPDEEHRVFYVAVTRAIENLYIKTPKTNKFFDL